MTLIEIRPHRWSWKIFEASGRRAIGGGMRFAVAVVATLLILVCSSAANVDFKEP
jgi:hypothetical protein